MSKEDVVGRLQTIAAELHDAFEGTAAVPGTATVLDLHGARLAQLDQAIAQAVMAAEHLFDEHERHGVDLVAHAKAIGAYVRPD